MAKKILFEVIATSKGLKVVGKEAQTLTTNTEKATKATDNLQKRRDKYMRTEKGAAGISSNSTKNFSKMQQSIDGGGGGGGLVRAYALLAANVFALTAAFGVLSRSAQIDTLTESMERLSATGGSSISAISRDLVTASGGAIAFADSMKQVALATSAGLGQEQITQLTTVAKGASIALGRNLGDSIDRIFRGAIKLEPELLDEIGLFVRVDEESSKYARTLGKSVTSLTQYEKRQAFLNGVIEQGTKKFQDFAEEVDPDPYSKLAASLGDIAQNVTSFVNKALGPLVGFLAESKGLLFAVFIGLSTILLRQAIPAISQFTVNLENSAAAALKDREAFINAQKAKGAAAKAFAMQQVKDQIKDQRKAASGARADTGGGFVSKAAGAQNKATLKEITNLNKVEGIEKRIKVINQQKLDLEKSRRTAKAKSKALIDAELKAIQLEKTELTQLLSLEQKRLAIKNQTVGATTGTLSDIENTRSLNKAIVGTGVASVLATAQNDGLKDGFKSFFSTIKTGEVVVDGNTEKLKGTAKASFIAKGSFGLLGASISRLFAALGPLMIALSILAPFMPALARGTGLVTKESQALNKSYSALSEQASKLDERFEIQTESIQNTKLAYVETRKAILAFNKTQAETGKMVEQARKDFDQFILGVSGFGKAWDDFKSVFGLDAESKLIKTELEVVKSTLDAALATDAGEETLKIFEDLGIEIDAYSKATGAAMKASGDLTVAENALENKTSTRLNTLRRLAEVQQTGRLRTGKDIADAKTVTAVEQKYIDAINANKTATTALKKERDNLNISDVQASAAIDKNTDLTTKNAEAEAKRTSALEGSREAVSKFQAAFTQTTKVDDVTASLNQLKQNVVNADDTDAAEKFFETFSKEPIALIFTKEQIKEIEKGGENARKVFNGTVDTFNEMRLSMAQSKNNLKNLTAQAKQFAIANKVGAAAAEKQASIETKIAQEKSRTTQLSFDALLSSKGLGEEDAKRIAKMSTVAEFQAEAKRLGKDEVDLMAIKNGFIENEISATEALFVANTENLRVKQDEAAVDQKALDVSKEALKLQQQSTLLTKQKAQFNRTGSTELTADQTFELEIQSKRDSLALARQEADIKKTLIDIEYGLLAERVKLMKIDETVRTKMLADLGTAQTNAKNNVDKAITNAENEVGVSIMNGFKSGLEQASGGDALGGLRTAIAAATAGEGAGGDGKTGGETITNAEGINLAKTALEGYRSSLMELGPEGEAVVAFADGALQIADSFNTFTTSMDKADKLKAVGGMISGVSAMMAANSKAQIAEIDNQIAAEKKRDGKSKESMAKIAALEAKKLAQQKKAFEQNKKMKMAETVINTAAAVVEALPNVFLAAAIGAMGAVQLAMIAKTQFQGGGASNVDVPKPTEINIGGKRNNRVDVSRQASSGETAYLRGGMGVGSNAQNFTGSAMGRKGYADGGMLVGERGPEVVTANEVIPNYELGGSKNMNLTFNVSALDGASVQEVLTNNQGAVVGAIRDAANSYGQDFLPDVNVGYGGDG